MSIGPPHIFWQHGLNALKAITIQSDISKSSMYTVGVVCLQRRVKNGSHGLPLLPFFTEGKVAE